MQSPAIVADGSNREHVGTIASETLAPRHPPFGLPCLESRTASASAPKGEQRGGPEAKRAATTAVGLQPEYNTLWSLA